MANPDPIVEMARDLVESLGLTVCTYENCDHCKKRYSLAGSALRAARALGRNGGLEEAAKVIDDYIAPHLEDEADNSVATGRAHHFCEEFGCGSFKHVAEQIRHLRDQEPA